MQDAWARQIGERIQQARKAAKLTQPELADLLVVHLRTVSNYEKGQHIPFQDMPKIAEILDTDLRWLLHGHAWQDPLDLIAQRLGRIEEALAEIVRRTPGLSTDAAQEFERELEQADLRETMRDEGNDAPARSPRRSGTAPRGPADSPQRP